MEKVRLVFLIVGVLELGAAIAGIQRLRLSTDSGVQIVHFGTMWARAVTGLIGVAFLVAGICGGFTSWVVVTAVFALLAVGLLVQGIVTAFTANDVFTQLLSGASQIVGAVIVGGFFIKWWLPKRSRLA